MAMTAEEYRERRGMGRSNRKSGEDLHSCEYLSSFDCQGNISLQKLSEDSSKNWNLQHFDHPTQDYLHKKSNLQVKVKKTGNQCFIFVMLQVYMFVIRNRRQFNKFYGQKCYCNYRFSIDGRRRHLNKIFRNPIRLGVLHKTYYPY